MGGFAVVIDWDRPVDPHAIDPMMALVPHRATGGTRTHVTPHAVLAEGRTTHQVDGGPWEVATLGPLAIVGDIRLFDTGRLRAAAGGSVAADGLDDRHLLLAAYRRRGIGFLDAVDGDFAFVIWDETERSVLAVRDRFAVKPIFYEETPTGIRFTSEVKQLAVTSLRPPEPDLLSLAEYVTYDFREKRRTFLTGIQRIPASEAIIAAGHTPRALRYWDPTPPTTRHEPSSLPHLFREHLIAAVDRRLKTSSHTVSQLSGGLDSPSIAAAAAILASRGEPLAFTTVSAVYDFPSIDESEWIHDIVASQPFPHHDFVPEVADIEQFDADMWTVDGPFVDPNRDMEHVTARIAVQLDAPLAMTGAGGDHLLYQARYLGDILRSGHLRRFARDTTAYARWSGMGLLPTLSAPVRQATPPRVRSIGRGVRRARSRDAGQSLFTGAIEQALESRPDESEHLGFRTATQNAIASDLREARLAWTNETQALVFGAYGVDLSHPFLDRDLAQFVVSIDPLDLPFDGRSKTLARQGFADALPGSVLGRRLPTFADEYMQEALRSQRTAYRSRFGHVAPWAHGLIDEEAYRSALHQYDSSVLPPKDVHDLWRSWRAMAWIGSFGAYRAAAD